MIASFVFIFIKLAKKTYITFKTSKIGYLFDSSFGFLIHNNLDDLSSKLFQLSTFKIIFAIVAVGNLNTDSS